MCIIILSISQNIVTHMTIARQQLGKHNPGVTLSTKEGHPSLGNRPINPFPWRQILGKQPIVRL
jgi:hypothetical protein